VTKIKGANTIGNGVDTKGAIQTASQCHVGGAVTRMNRCSIIAEHKGQQRGVGVGARTIQARDQR
jgi:hypothetical protein